MTINEAIILLKKLPMNITSIMSVTILIFLFSTAATKNTLIKVPLSHYKSHVRVSQQKFSGGYW